ncbi:MAG: hypothetical protein ACE5EX_05525 [Phycisphaerae bacterium]
MSRTSAETEKPLFETAALRIFARAVHAGGKAAPGVPEKPEVPLVPAKPLLHPVELPVAVQIEQVGQHVAAPREAADRPVLLRVSGRGVGPYDWRAAKAQAVSPVRIDEPLQIVLLVARHAV